MEKWIIHHPVENRDYTLEYDEDKHIYLVDGVILPSVSKIIDFAYPDTYKDSSGNKIDSGILKRASELGTKMHKSIEDYELKGIDDLKNIELQNYKKLKKQKKLETIGVEMPVIIFKDAKPCCCGRLDFVGKQDGRLCVNDNKRTSQLHLDRLCLQLSLYAIGYEQCYSIKKDDIQKVELVNCMHLRKDSAEYVNVKLDKYNAIMTLRKYELENQIEDDFNWE